MIPHPLVLLLLTLAAYRSWRLAALDTFPPIVWVRDKLLGSVEAGYGADVHDQPELRFRRLLIAEWLGCPYCAGLWASAAWYVAWLEWPRASVYAAVPLAINAAWASLQVALPD